MTEQVVWRRSSDHTWMYGTLKGGSVRLWETGTWKLCSELGVGNLRVLVTPYLFMDTDSFSSADLRAIVAMQGVPRDGQRAVYADRNTKEWKFGQISVVDDSQANPLIAFEEDQGSDPTGSVVMHVLSASTTPDVVIQTCELTDLKPGNHLGVLTELHDGTWPQTAQTVSMQWQKVTVVGVSYVNGVLDVRACFWGESVGDKCIKLTENDAFFRFAADVPSLSVGDKPLRPTRQLRAQQPTGKSLHSPSALRGHASKLRQIALDCLLDATHFARNRKQWMAALSLFTGRLVGRARPLTDLKRRVILSAHTDGGVSCRLSAACVRYVANSIRNPRNIAQRQKDSLCIAKLYGVSLV